MRRGEAMNVWLRWQRRALIAFVLVPMALCLAARDVLRKTWGKEPEA